ncbi:XdhC family protein [Bacteroidota bacterium]
MKDLSLWKFVLTCLQNNIQSVLMIVVDSEGFSPGKPGFKMVAADDGTLCGSIGGGIMEYNLVEKARDMLSKKNYNPILEIQIHNLEADSDKSGMICGGKQTLILFPFKLEQKVIVEGLIHSIENNKTAKFIVTKNNIIVSPERIRDKEMVFKKVSPTEWIYEENLGIRYTAYIIGGGHVGLAMSKVLALLDFYTVVIDDRPDVSTLKENIYADEIVTLPYDKIQEYIPEGDNNYVIIMTPSHRGDETSLKQVINKKLAYIGMMGSSRKVKEVFGNMSEAGFSEDKLKKVHSPIGLPIKSNTPEEIAISIAAEIIQVKNSVGQKMQ